ncbi:MAG: NAD(P)/FAD-dependent oxidoreductase [Mycobacterium sp.]|nr:NAD(P)/FAD-dependent oxidoreductase [Mycobacterium sp.]
MSEFVDVVIVGAGISGISAAWHLQKRCPDKSFVILERREDLGGTWDLFKYPGIRSDSDMFTLGFRFKPWESAKAIADGPSIKAYIKEAAVENGIDKSIRYGHRVVAADWSDADHRWTITVEHDGQQSTIQCGFAMACSGYYNYDEPFTPEFPGTEDFTGTIVHPQHWPEDLDVTGKKIVVIGSGATAITLIPALADTGAGHVTMLQRSPTYVGSLPLVDPVAEKANKFLPRKAAHFINRWKAVGFSTAQYQLSQRFPKYMRKTLLTMAKHRLPEGYEVEKHFGPSYNPWDERLCLAPNGDLFKTIRHGKADVVTDTIDRFDATGIKLTSGAHLDADIIVTATGLNLQLFGGAKITRDGEPVDPGQRLAYRALMLEGMPNAAFTFGYVNASWTLKADLVSEYVCRLLNYMDEHGYDTVEPVPGSDDIERLPFTDMSSGYFARAMHLLPKRGARGPWQIRHNYFWDIYALRHARFDDDALHFTKNRVAASVSA